MKTDVDTCLKDIADWYIKNRRSITEPELDAILKKHVESEAEARKFVGFLETEPGQLRFKTLLREKKEGGMGWVPDAKPEKPSYLKVKSPPTIHEATSENPDPAELMPIEVPSAFPEGAPSTFNPEEKAQIDRFINEVPDKNDTGAINYWLDWGDRKVYLEGWIDKCLAGTGFPPMEGGEWDEKIQYMVRDTHRTLIEKQKERNLTLIEGGFREFEAGDKAWLYGVSWGVYEKKAGASYLKEAIDTFTLGRELQKLTPGMKVEVLQILEPKFFFTVGECDDVKKRIAITLWQGATDKDAKAILAHEYAHIEPKTCKIRTGTTEAAAWQKGEDYAKAWGVLPEYLKLAEELADFYEARGIYPRVAQGIRQYLSGRASYLKEEAEECQIISPQYYDILGWLNIPVPDYSFAIEPEVKERKIDEVLQKLKDGVSRIHESAIFREFLITMAKFHVYSIGNQILIMLQRRDATRVAGIKTWNELGRYVKRGEKGIAILAPCLPPRFEERWRRGRAEWVIRKVPPEEREFGIFSVRSEDGVLVMPPILIEKFRTKWEAERRLREWGAEVPEIEPTPTYFKVVYVFDVAQTEGKPLPEIAVPVLSGAYSEELYNKLMKLATKHSLTVSFEPRPDLPPEIKGTLLAKMVWIKPDEPEAQRLKTLAHEEAHYFTEAVYFIPKAEAEVIAESAAFVVCAHFGFDTGVRSFPYVAFWAKEKKALEQNLASIRKISGRMIEELG